LTLFLSFKKTFQEGTRGGIRGAGLKRGLGLPPDLLRVNVTFSIEVCFPIRAKQKRKKGEESEIQETTKKRNDGF